MLENHHIYGYNADHFFYFHIKHGADILARRMFFRGPALDLCIKQFIKFRHWFHA